MTNDELKLAIQNIADQEYNQWKDGMQQINEPELILKEDFIVDIDPDPRVWLRNGLRVIEGNNTREDEFLTAHHSYPVFCIGTELFLKGLLLFKNKSSLPSPKNLYLNEKERAEYEKIAKENYHNLILLINDLIKDKAFKTDKNLMDFLQTVRGIIYQHYIPLSKNAKNELKPWADERYPIVIYSNSDQNPIAERINMKTFPRKVYIVRLFKEAYNHLTSNYPELSPKTLIN